MKKLFLGLVLFLTATLVLNYTKVEAGEIPTYDLTVQVQLGENTPTPRTAITGLEYGQVISFDVGTWEYENYEFLGFIVEGKVAQTIQEAQTFRMNETMDIVAYFKPVNTTAVIFMDSNHDFVDVKYTDGSGVLTQVPAFTELSKPGLAAVGWNVENIASHVFAEDTIVYLEYANDSGVKTLTYDEGAGVATTTFAYNSLVTVTANGSGTFSHWLKDGKVASLNQTYKFTMVDDHTVEAVYDDASFVPDSDTLVTVSDIFEVETGYDTIVGQFHLGANEEVVEWGIVESEIPGGITFDTPDVEIFKSTRYNETSNEFMMSFNQTATEIINYRGFVTTINTLTGEVKTTYSYYQEIGVEESFVETFDTSNATGSYNDSSFVGIEGINWTYTESRDGNSDANSSGINLPALMLRDNTSTISSNTISGGISFFEVKLYKGFTGGGSRQVEVFINGESVGTSDVFDDYYEHILLIENINIEGDFTIEIKNITAKQIIIDDITWGYSTPSILATEANTPSSITITGDTSVNMNESIQLSADTEAVIWVSSDSEVLTVDQTGLVTGVTEGTANVTAHSFYNHSVLDTITITGLGLVTYDVTFDNDGTTNVVTVDGGNPVAEPTDPTKAGYVFEGWFTSSDGGLTLDTEWNFATGVQDNITLYANWVEISSILDLRTDGTAAYVQGIVTGKDSGSTYINDGTAAIAIYDWNLYNSTVAVGDEVLFTNNTTSTYNGLLQLSYVSYDILSSLNTLPAAVVLNDLSEVTSAYQTQRISISDLEVVSVVGSDLTLTDGTTQVVVYGLSSGFLSTVAPGQAVNLVNIHVGWYNGLEFNVLSDAEVELAPLSDAEKVAGIKAELIADFDGNEYASNSTITLPSTSTVYGGTIAWYSSNTSVINVAGSAGTFNVQEVATETAINLTAAIDVNGTTDTQVVSITVLPSGVIVYSTDLFISEYIEGSGTTRAIEIYNNTGVSVDLSDYTITNYYNGNSTVSSAYIYTLSGTLQHGETYVLYHASSVATIIIAAQTADLYFGSSSSFINFNGDDAIVLAKNGTNIDVIGVIGTDPGSAWTVGDVSTANKTLVRNGDVINPTITWDSTEWTAYTTDTSDYLGTHTISPE
jgi:uncharacterized repeat protein (TIGR02543 family)